MVINHNMNAMFAHRTLQNTMIDGEKSVQKLASGERINRAGDDASGLAVSEKMRSQIRGLMQAGRNMQNGISFLQTAEGYMDETSQIFNRIRELAVQSANGIYSTEDRMMMQVEVSQLVDEIDRIASHAQFNEMNLLTGRFANDSQGQFVGASMWFHIGANMDQRERSYIGTMTSRGLGLRNLTTASFITLSSPNDANRTIGTIDQALMRVSKQRSDLGGYQTRLEFAVKGILVGYENLQAAESRIRDTDMAQEMSDFVKNQILTHTATAMLGQANMKPQAVLRLLQ